MTAHSFHTAAAITAASYLVILALWTPGSLVLAGWLREEKTWFPVWLATSLLAGIIFGCIALALEIIGWAIR